MTTPERVTQVMPMQVFDLAESQVVPTPVLTSA